MSKRSFSIDIESDDGSIRIAENRGPWQGGRRLVVITPEQLSSHRIEWVRELQQLIQGEDNDI